MIIDIHTHCFPDAIAQDVLTRLSFNGGGLKPYTDGTLSGLLRSMDLSGIDVSCVMNIAQHARGMRRVNDFAVSQQSARIVPFGSVNPHAPDCLEELERIAQAGLRGIKFHPDYQEFDVDDPSMRPVYQKAGRFGLVMLFHAGCDVGFMPPYRGGWRRFANAAKWFEGDVVLAHMGGMGFSREAADALSELPVYFDTAFCYGTVSKPLALLLIERVGAGRLLFGSDSPWHKPEMDRRLIDTLGFSADERDAVMGLNAARLLGLMPERLREPRDARRRADCV